jgi:hypothetical protein
LFSRPLTLTANPSDGELELGEVSGDGLGTPPQLAHTLASPRLGAEKNEDGKYRSKKIRKLTPNRTDE